MSGIFGLYRVVRERDDNIASAFNDLRRSTAVQRLAAMIVLEAVTDEELSQFSADAREAANGLANLWRDRGKRRNDLYHCARRVLAKKIVALPIYGRSDRSRNKSTSTVWANIV